MNQNDLREAQRTVQQINFADAAEDFWGTQASAQIDQAILENMTKEQIEAAKHNPQLRKKLIVDRIKRKTMGESAFQARQTASVVDDPGEAEWVKHKQLREIEQIRNLKKELMISQIAGTHNADSHKIHLCPGIVNFFRHPLENKKDEREVYEINIIDPERELSEEAEVALVYSAEEMAYWEQLGKGKQYPSKNTIRQTDTVHLEAGQKIELLFKCITFRDVDPKAEKSTHDLIKPRVVEIVVINVGTRKDETVKLELVPQNPMIDLTLRHFEPEHSYFELTIPPFMEFSEDKTYTFRLSKGNAKALLDKKSNLITVQGKTGDTLTSSDF